MDKNLTLIVIAGSFKEYQVWAQTYEDDFHRAIRKAAGFPLRAKYCTRPEQLQGLNPEEVKVIYTGTFWVNPLSKSRELRRLDPNPPDIHFYKNVYKTVRYGILYGRSIEKCQLLDDLLISQADMLL